MELGMGRVGHSRGQKQTEVIISKSTKWNFYHASVVYAPFYNRLERIWALVVWGQKLLTSNGINSTKWLFCWQASVWSIKPNLRVIILSSFCLPLA